MFVFTLLFGVLLLTTEGLPTENLLSRRFVGVCDVKLIKKISDINYTCCKSRNVNEEEYQPYINIGVCPSGDAVAVTRLRMKNVTVADSMSDASATDDKPGLDEGECHVYRAWAQFKVKDGFVCLPGNMVKTAMSIQQHLGEGSCQLVDIPGCNKRDAEPLKPDTRYSYQIKLLNNPDASVVNGMFGDLPGCTLLDGGDMVKCNL